MCWYSFQTFVVNSKPHFQCLLIPENKKVNRKIAAQKVHKVTVMVQLLKRKGLQPLTPVGTKVSKGVHVQSQVDLTSSRPVKAEPPNTWHGLFQKEISQLGERT